MFAILLLVNQRQEEWVLWVSLKPAQPMSWAPGLRWENVPQRNKIGDSQGTTPPTHTCTRTQTQTRTHMHTRMHTHIPTHWHSWKPKHITHTHSWSHKHIAHRQKVFWKWPTSNTSRTRTLGRPRWPNEKTHYGGRWHYFLWGHNPKATRVAHRRHKTHNREDIRYLKVIFSPSYEHFSHQEGTHSAHNGRIPKNFTAFQSCFVYLWVFCFVLFFNSLVYE